MTTINAWAGGQAPDGFRVVARFTGTTARLAVSTADDLSAPSYVTGSVASGRASFTATGLPASTDHWYALEVDGALDTTWVGKVRTAPAAGTPASFRFAASSCAGQSGSTDLHSTGVSNHPAFDTIRQAAPDFFVHTGDMFYRDPNSTGAAQFHTAWDAVLAAPRQADLYRSCGLVYMADDHDGGPDNRDRTAVSAPYYKQAYRERIPSHPLTDPSGLWHTFVWGRVRFIVTDCRTERDPHPQADDASKHLLGVTQDAWFTDTLAAADEPLIVWISTLTWGGPADPDEDVWRGYNTERTRLGQIITGLGLSDRLVVISGDAHANGIDDGTNNAWGAFPELVFSAIDSGGGYLAGDWSHGWIAGKGQYGVVDITDTGAAITLTATAYQDTTAQMSLTVSRRTDGAELTEVVAVRMLVDGELVSATKRTLADIDVTPVASWVLVPGSS